MTKLTRRDALAGGGLALLAMTTGGRPAGAQTGPIRIGIIQATAGPAGAYGPDAILGAQIAVDHVNAAGGIDGRKVELVVRETQSSLNDSLSQFRQLSAEGVKLLVGPTGGSSLINAMLPLLEGENVVMAATHASMNATHELFTRHFFRQIPNAYMWWSGGGRLMAKLHPDILKWTGVLTELDVSRQGWGYFTRGLTEAHKQAGRAVEIIPPVTAKFGASDYRNQLASVVGSPATGLFCGLLGADAISFLQQSVGMNLSAKTNAIFDFASGLEIPRALKNNTPPNTYTIITWVESAFDTPTSKSFSAEFKKRTNTALATSFGSQSYAMVMNYVNAIRAAKSAEPKAVIDALERITVEDTPYPPYRFRKEDHQIEQDLGFIKTGPAAGEPGWTAEFTSLPWQQAIEPPTPGVKFDL
jgi:branched-chain amino acid transport system substrate-binding protein